MNGQPDTSKIIFGSHSTEKNLRAKELRSTMTPAEQLLWQRLRRNQLGGNHFRRQQVLDGFIVDFYCHSSGLVIEVDGGIHDSQVEYDQEREQVLMNRGLRIIRFSNARVLTETESVLAEILAATDA